MRSDFCRLIESYQSVIAVSAVIIAACAHGAAAAEPQAAEIAFFEKKIRPVLVQYCYECHSAKAHAANKLKGGLRVDSRDALLAGGESGPAIVPGKPAESLLIDALRYESFQMPPKGKLPDTVVADFVKWIELGAPDPRRDDATASSKKGIDVDAGRQHWCYRLPQLPRIPELPNATWPATDIDRFVLATLEANGLQPSRDADRLTLIRRLYFDLIGLPPTPEQIDGFLSDSSPEAYERLVDELLASQHFGERWGRHWLDVARYAESLTLRGFILKDAWRYRDYVIDAFNRDLPFDQFVREQIAGDLLQSAGDSLDERRRKMIATTFLAIGNTNLEEQDKKQLEMDVVDEQLETVGKAFLAQTIGCARCHDHKFDPIPTRDYYALAGIFKNSKTLEHANVSKWMEVPLPMPPDQEAAIARHDEQIAALKSRIEAEKKLAKADAESPNTAAGKKTLALSEIMGIVVDDSQAKKVGHWKDSTFSSRFVGDGYIHDEASGKGEKTITFVPELPVAGRYEVRLSYAPGTNRAPEVPVTVFSADGEKTIKIDQQQKPPIDDVFVSLGQHRFEANGQGFVLIGTEGTMGHVIADAVVFIPVEKLPDAPMASAKPATANNSSADPPPKPNPNTIKKLEEELKQFQATGPKRDTVITVVEASKIEDLRINIRGSVRNLGESAPRGFLQVATYGDATPMPQDQSGRRELAEWLADRNNPLTSRVIVNRVWHWLFGTGLVRTTDNFGTTGEAPSHPELLDYLAVRFMENDWSIKQLVRELVLSRTYRQSSSPEPRGLAADPENRWLWRMNRRRLEAECIRDAILSVSGQLDVASGGPTFDQSLAADYGYQHKDTRRSVYSPLFRNSLPELFEVFDAADPSMVTGRRNVSTVAPQALFLMNHPFVLEQSRLAAERLSGEPNLDDKTRLGRAYRLCFGRPPTDAERDIAARFISAENDNDGKRWALLLQSLFGSIDFRYLD